MKTWFDIRFDNTNISLKYFKYSSYYYNNPSISVQRPYNIIRQIFLSPISGNSNEDLHENWITGVLRMHNIFEIVHIIYAYCMWCAAFNRPTVWQIPRTHEQTLKDYYILCACRWRAGPAIITVLKSRVLGAISIICRDFFGYTIVCGFPLDRA